jgi:NitT/TauT family transport system ATP-binding protein
MIQERLQLVPKAEQSTAIQLYGLTKTFATKTGEFTALQDVSLDIKHQEFLCIIGPSGCGKSTILSLISGIEKATHGKVIIDGKDAEVARRERRIGLVFQDAVLLPWRTVDENAKLPLEIIGTPRQEQKRIVADILKLVNLSGFENRFPHELSGGMRQRLGIGRALTFDPEILLMDEPFGALDAITRDQMSTELLRIWQQRQKTVVFVTHSIPESILLSDRIMVMGSRPGHIRALIDNPLPRPRSLDIRDTPDFQRLTRELRQLLEA